MIAGQKTIFFISPFDTYPEALNAVVRAAVKSAQVDAKVISASEMPFSGYSLLEHVYEGIDSSDLLICDITNLNTNVVYELGYAHGAGKPVILISQRQGTIPSNLLSMQLIYYDVESADVKEFVQYLAIALKKVLENPKMFTARSRVNPNANRVFISYSHKDKAFLDRLMVHMKPLEKEGIIELWADTKLVAGDKWEEGIHEALRKSRVAILLITADFLASDFIVDNELPPILANAETQGTRVIPVILKPCRFTRNKSLSCFQAVNNPNAPLDTLPGSEQEQIYDDVSELVEGLLGR